MGKTSFCPYIEMGFKIKYCHLGVGTWSYSLKS